MFAMNAKTVNLSVLSWNVRGLGDDGKCKIVRDTLSARNITIACIQETKLRSVSPAKASFFLPPNLSNFHCVDAAGTRGGILTAWDDRALAMTSFITRRHSLTLFFMSRASDATFAVTNVYAPADHHDSQHFLEDWIEVASHVDSNWLVAGDFNLTRNADENSNGTLHQNLARCSMTPSMPWH